MLVEFRNWVGTVIAGYTFAYGQWVEGSGTDSNWYCVVQAAGGPAPVVDVRYPRFRVILLGRRNARQDAQQLIEAIDALVDAGMVDSLPCGAASVRAMSEP